MEYFHIFSTAVRTDKKHEEQLVIGVRLEQTSKMIDHRYCYLSLDLQ